MRNRPTAWWRPRGGERQAGYEWESEKGDTFLSKIRPISMDISPARLIPWTKCFYGGAT